MSAAEETFDDLISGDVDVEDLREEDVQRLREGIERKRNADWRELAGRNGNIVKGGVGLAFSVAIGVFTVYGYYGREGAMETVGAAVAVVLLGTAAAFSVGLAREAYDEFDWLSNCASTVVSWLEDAVLRLTRKTSRLQEARTDMFESFAHGILMHEGSHTIDSSHHVDYARSTIDLTGDQTVIRERFEGENRTMEESRWIHLYVTKDANISVREMDFEVEQWNGERGEMVPIPAAENPYAECEADEGTWYAEEQGSFGVLFHVPFREPLAPFGSGADSRFELELSLKAGEAPEDQNYQWVPQHRFQEGTDELVAECRVPGGYVVESVRIDDIEVDKESVGGPLDVTVTELGDGDEGPGGEYPRYWWDPDGTGRVYRCEDRDADALYLFRVDTAT